LLDFTVKRKVRIEARKFYFSFHLEFCYNKDYIATSRLLFQEDKQLQPTCDIPVGWTELTGYPTSSQNSYGQLQRVVTCQLAGLN